MDIKNLKKILFLWIIVFFIPGNFICYAQTTDTSHREKKFALIEAARLKMMGNIEEALKLYLSCVKSYPDCAAAWYEISSIYTASGLMVEAEESIMKAYHLDKNNYWYSNAYAEILTRNNKYEESNKVLKKLKKNFPKEEIWIDYKTAENYYNSKKYKEALKIFNNIENKFGVSEMISARKIEIYNETGNDNAALNEFKKIFNNDPDNISFNILYAEYLVDKGQVKDAIERYEHLLTIDEENIYAISNLTELYESIGEKEKSYTFLVKTFKSEEIPLQKKIQMLSYLLSDEGRVKNDNVYLIEIIDHLYHEQTNNIDFLILAYDFYNKINDVNRAFEIIKKIIELRKDNYVIWAQALYNGIQTENYFDVIELGLEALKIFPNKDDLRVFISLSYFNLNNYAQAYEMLLDCNDNFTEPELKKQKEMLLAESAYKSGNIMQSFKMFDFLIEEYPDNLIIKNNYSYYLALEEIELEKAKKLSYETILAEPESSTFLDTYAWILYKMANYTEAEKYIRKAVAFIEGYNEEILEHMIEILIKNGKIEEAEMYRLKLKN